MIEVYLLVSGSGERVDLGAAIDLDGATRIVYDLDVRYMAWEAAGFPPLCADDPLGVWEGCDVYAQEEGVLLVYENDGEWGVF